MPQCLNCRSTKTIKVVNAKTAETLRLCRKHFIAALNAANRRTREGVIAAVKRQAGAS